MKTRLLKPELFVNDKLADIGPHGQLLFMGQWFMTYRDDKAYYTPLVKPWV
jgi:hypothetical protein